MKKSVIIILALTLLSSMFKFAIRGGALSTIGIKYACAILWLNVTLPSALGHIITMGELAIVLPKPMAIQPREEVPEEVRVYWVVEFGKTVADMHMSGTHLESPVRPKEDEFAVLTRVCIRVSK